MGDALVAGLDFGTSSLKASVWNGAGEQLATAAQAYASYDAGSGGVEQCPNDWWQATVAVIQRLVKATQGRGNIAAIGLSGPIGNIVYVDSEGHLLLERVPTWQDLRPAEALAAMERDFARGQLDDWLGIHLPPGTNWPIPHLRWLARSRPEVLARTRWLAQTKDYIGWQLTGNWVTDASSWRGLVHLPEGRSIPEVMAYLGLDASVIPPRQPPDTSRGTVLPKLAEQLGLGPRVSVTTGWNDLNAAVLGGNLKRGEGFDLAGTSDHFGRVLAEGAGTDPRLTLAPYLEGMQLWYGVTAASGGSLAWWQKNWWGEAQGGSWVRVLDDVQRVAPGSLGLLFLPHLAGERAPLWDAKARGAFIGLTRAHQPQHGLRAVMEGVAFHLRTIQMVLEQQGALAYVKAAGGPMAVEPWNQIRADILGVPFWIANDLQVGCRGAGMLASELAGVDPQQLHGSWRVVEPDPDRHAHYEEFFGVYQTLYPRLQEVFARLGDLA